MEDQSFTCPPYLHVLTKMSKQIKHQQLHNHPKTLFKLPYNPQGHGHCMPMVWGQNVLFYFILFCFYCFSFLSQSHVKSTTRLVVQAPLWHGLNRIGHSVFENIFCDTQNQIQWIHEQKFGWHAEQLELPPKRNPYVLLSDHL